MKAWVLHNIRNLQYEEVETPIPAEDEVLVRVKAAGVCGSDIPRIYRDGAHNMPLIPGHEFSGEVVSAGGEAGEAWLGKRVGIFPLIPCRECVACRMGRHEMCRSYSYLGSRRDGAFAEYVAVPVSNLIELPENVSYGQAAMMEPMAVAVHAMRRVRLQRSDTVVVCGLGTIGVLLTMFLLEKGVKNLLVVGNKDYQKKQVMSLGLSEDRYCDCRSQKMEEWISQKTDGLLANIFFECVGKNETVSQAVNMTMPGGQICLVGNPYSDMTLDKQTYWLILRNQLEITGTWNSSFYTKCQEDGTNLTDWEYALSLLQEGKIRPEQFISHEYPMQDLAQGMVIMRDKKEDYLKVMALQE